MRRILLHCLCYQNYWKRLFLFFFLFLAGKQQTIAQNPGDNFFNSSQVHQIDISFQIQNWWDSLTIYKKISDSTQQKLFIRGDLIINGKPMNNVGVALKGNSSYGYPGFKKPIKLDFNEYVDGQDLDGLKRLNLNNNVLDPTHMREKLFLDFFEEKGIPAPRATYARVSFNGQYVGLYKAIEQVDKTFLETHFKNNGGNLFKGDPAGTLSWAGSNQASYYKNYELKTNEKENDWSDLLRLISVINQTPNQVFKDSLEKAFHVKSFLRDWAASNLFVDLDKYYNNPHNYYIYRNTATNKFEWITWDVSVVFGFFPFWTEHQTTTLNLFYQVNPPQARPLTYRIFQIDEYRRAYLSYVCEFLDYFRPEVLFPKIDSIANVIRPHILDEPKGNQMFPIQHFDQGKETTTIKTPAGDIPGLKSFIANRRAHVRAQLAAMNWNCALTNADEQSETANLATRVWPNPFHNSLELEFTTQKPVEVFISLVNALGQVIPASKTETRIITAGTHREHIQIENSDLQAGIYFLQLRVGDSIQVHKLIKTP